MITSKSLYESEEKKKSKFEKLRMIFRNVMDLLAAPASLPTRFTRAPKQKSAPSKTDFVADLLLESASVTTRTLIDNQGEDDKLLQPFQEQCCECRDFLENESTCFESEGSIYCSDDFFRYQQEVASPQLDFEELPIFPYESQEEDNNLLQTYILRGV